MSCLLLYCAGGGGGAGLWGGRGRGGGASSFSIKGWWVIYCGGVGGWKSISLEAGGVI